MFKSVVVIKHFSFCFTEIDRDLQDLSFICDTEITDRAFSGTPEPENAKAEEPRMSKTMLLHQPFGAGPSTFHQRVKSVESYTSFESSPISVDQLPFDHSDDEYHWEPDYGLVPPQAHPADDITSDTDLPEIFKNPPQIQPQLSVTTELNNVMEVINNDINNNDGLFHPTQNDNPPPAIQGTFKVSAVQFPNHSVGQCQPRQTKVEIHPPTSVSNPGEQSNHFLSWPSWQQNGSFSSPGTEPYASK